MSQRRRWPVWVRQDFEHNLREVAPNLFVGAEFSPRLRPRGAWLAVVDFYGKSALASHQPMYAGVGELHRLAFDDGDAFPAGVLDEVLGVARRCVRRGPVLLHCQAGLSRSASAAYGLLRLAGMTHEQALPRVKIEANFPRRATLGSANRWATELRRQG